MADTDAGPNQGASEPNEGNDSTSTTTQPPSPHDVEMARLNSENRKSRLANKALQDEVEKLKQANASESEQAVMKARSEGEATYKAKYRDAMLANAAITRLTEKKVLAADLALRALNLSEVDIDMDTGRVDTKAIDEQIDELVTRYPQLILSEGGPKPPPSLSGKDQRRVTQEDLLKAADAEERNKLLRFALGGK